jgi:hypothetical protein
MDSLRIECLQIYTNKANVFTNDYLSLCQFNKSSFKSLLACNVANPWFYALPSLEGAIHLSVVQPMLNVPRCRADQCWTPFNVEGNLLLLPARVPICGLQSYSDLHNTNEYTIVSVLFRPLSKIMNFPRSALLDCEMISDVTPFIPLSQEVQ